VLGTASGYFPDHGIQLEEGLESYDGAVTVGNYSNTSLKYNSGGGFTAWSGHDSQSVNNPPMCGAFYPADDNWISGENSC
jgi:hypothetical protein